MARKGKIGENIRYVCPAAAAAGGMEQWMTVSGRKNVLTESGREPPAGSRPPPAVNFRAREWMELE